MDIIQDSTEHYFLARLEDIKNKPQHWYGLYFPLSATLNHADLMQDHAQISHKLSAARTDRDTMIEDLRAALQDTYEGTICVFSDLDIIVLIKAPDPKAIENLQNILKGLQMQLSKSPAQIKNIGNEIRFYEKFADAKLLSKRRFESYDALNDHHKIASIPLRRKRRSDPLIMLVEDDRFTAHYASSILSAEFDLLLCKNGEEALQAYIETAPDVVFLDIHLPGMKGDEVLQTLRAADPEAFVVMLSVDTMQDNVVKTTKDGAVAFLKKPFSKERLLKTARNSPHIKAR